MTSQAPSLGTVLVIDDERQIHRFLRPALEATGYAVLEADQAREGLRLAASRAPDLVLLDLGLPGKSGTELLRALRDAGDTVPVLVLTARGTVADRVRGLDDGADDYLAKPFDFVELTARIKSILRRGQPRDSNTLRVADLELDLTRRKATRQGDTILLTAKEFALLWLLMRREGEILPRATIASQVWDMNFNSDTNVVDSAIRRLRSKIDDAYEPKLIHTVRGMGYVLEARGGAAA